MKILRSYLNCWHNWQMKNRRRSLKNIYRLSLISTGSISLDSTFKQIVYHVHKVWQKATSAYWQHLQIYTNSELN
jgi:hypothetical protein